MQALTVYKASAGSGKTFTLATEYIKLVVSNPNSYRNILAVTFTNKATEEMKMRILSQLYGIWKQLPDSRGYLDKVREGLDLTDRQIADRAGLALHLLIHNYNYFRVETIDAFFQSVLRNLARELDLTANLRIGLNDYQVEQQAVDELIESLDTNNKMLSWIMDYIQENIDDDKSWNVIGQIKKFGENIFRDYYKDASKVLNEKLDEKEFFPTFTKKMRAMRKEAQDKLRKIADDFFAILDQNNLSVTDYVYGTSGVCSYFVKLQKGVYDESLLGSRVLKGMDDPANWVSKAKAKPGNAAYDLAASRLRDYLLASEECRPKWARIVKSTDLTLRHLNQLRLLSSIEKKVREMNEEANRFLLSDTQTLLGSLIEDSDSPFIFEKIGTQLDHIMIDEFQDTSIVQWKNFKVLLEETMSRSEEEYTIELGDKHITTQQLINNMLVGDVKQSIYRWRSGDWRLLNDIQQQFDADAIDIRSLSINRRSTRNVIEFNNAFFTEAAEIEYQEQVNDENPEAPQLRNAYADVAQGVPDDKPVSGEVQIELLPADDYQETMMEKTMDTVDYLFSKGVPEKDMAILVRSHSTIQNIADYFMQNRPEIKLVSDEAFRLDASMAIAIIIDALRFLTHPADQLTLAQLVKAYQKQIIDNHQTDSDLFVHNESKNEAVDRLLSYLPEEFCNRTTILLTMPLFDLVDELYRIFRLNSLKGQSAYICAFYDQLSSWLQDNTSDIESFLRAWDDDIHQKTIQSDEIDGIRLITIHKSKGLEFDHVIMPFCDWKLEQGSTIWCQPQEAPYNELPLVPVDFNANQMKGSIYEADYKHEHLQNIVDNLNLLYVAFTRAGKNLYVFGKRGATTTRSDLIEKSLENVAQKLRLKDYEVTLEGADADKTEPLTFSFGTMATTDASRAEKVSTNVFLAPVEAHAIDIESFASKVEFRQSNKSRDFTLSDDEAEDQQHQYITMGTLLHSLFSTIRTTDDIEPAVRQLELDGIIYDENITREKLQVMLRKRLTDPQVADWFSPHWQLFNECTILKFDEQSGEAIEHRPDRVMTDGNEMIVVDFKFGKPKEEYLTQVRDYMDLLRQMGHTQIKGYLWFVYTNKIVEVK